MKHFDGKRSRGSHTSLIDLAKEVVEIADKIPGVTGIAPGYIRNGKAVAGGRQRVRIADEKGGMLLTVRQAQSVQDLRIYASDMEAAKLELARALRNEGIPISFRS